MKKILFVLLIISIFQPSFAGQRDYLIMTESVTNRLKEQIKSDPQIKEAWNNLLKKSKQLLKKDRNSIFDLQAFGVTYRVTEDEKYAEKIKETLFRLIQKSTWEDRGLLNRTPPWSAGLNTAKATFNTSFGFDCIYDYLTNKERAEIATGIVKLGIKPTLGDWINPETSFHTFDTMGHNWWSGVVDIAGFASLALRNEIPEALGWAEIISNASVEWFNYSGSVLQNKIPSFDRNGGFWESINYANFGFSQYLLFRFAQKNVLGSESLPALTQLEPMADFFINTTYYTSGETMSVNFGDGNLHVNGHACLLMLWNLGYQKDRYAWYLNKTNFGENHEWMSIESPLGLALNPVLSEKQKSSQPRLATSQLYPDMNWATLRNSWNDNATLLAVKSGLTWNHSHADAGSYILFHKGKNLIIDSGNSSYGNPLYTQYYCQSEAHNVVLFNGEGQDRKDPYFGTVNHGGLYNLIEGKNFRSILADATGPYSHMLSRNYRSFIWIGDVILVIDDLLAHEAGQFEWLLHYNGVSKRRGMNLSIKQDDAEVLVHPIFPETFPNGGLPHDFPEQMRLEEKLGYEDHHPENRIPYWSISHFEQTARTKFVTAIILNNENNKASLPTVERIRGNDFIGIKIKQHGETTKVYFNLLADGRLKHRNSVNHIDGFDTDAYIFAVTGKNEEGQIDTEDIEQLFVSHGSYVRKDGQVLIHALSKYTALVEGFNSKPTIQFDGQKGVEFHFFNKKALTEVSVNETEVKANFNSSKKYNTLIIQ